MLDSKIADQLIKRSKQIKNNKSYDVYYFYYKGKSYSYSKYSSAYQKLDELINGVQNEKKVMQEKSDHLIKNEIVLWYNSILSMGKKNSTYTRIHQIIECHIIPSVGSIPLKMLTYDDILKMCHNCSSSSTAKKCYQYLHKFYNDIHFNFDIDPFCGFSYSNNLPDVTIDEKVFNSEEYGLLMSECINIIPRYWFAIYLLGITGMRVGECLALNLSDIKIDLYNNYYNINVKKSISSVVVYDDYESSCFDTNIQKTKTSTSTRLIPISFDTVKKFGLYCFNTSDIYDIYNKLNSVEDRPIFSTTSGSILSYRNLVREFDKLLKTLKINRKNRSLHSLRHTFATASLNSGLPVHFLSKYLGHSSVSITLDIYCHNSASDCRDFIDKFDPILPDFGF